MFSFSPYIDSGGIGTVKKVRKLGFELVGQDWGTPGDIPIFGCNGHGLGWPELILLRRVRDTARKKVSI